MLHQKIVLILKPEVSISKLGAIKLKHVKKLSLMGKPKSVLLCFWVVFTGRADVAKTVRSSGERWKAPHNASHQSKAKSVLRASETEAWRAVASRLPAVSLSVQSTLWHMSNYDMPCSCSLTPTKLPTDDKTQRWQDASGHVEIVRSCVYVPEATLGQNSNRMSKSAVFSKGE